VLGTGAFAAATAAVPHTGSIPDVGPAVAQSSGAGGFGGGGIGGRGSAPSGAQSGTNSSTSLTAALKATTTRWTAATVGDQSAAELELSSGSAVMAIGGWSGSDNSPTLDQFKAYVASGEIRYFIAGNAGGGGLGGPGGGSGVGSEITTWVTAHFAATTIGGQTVYDLTKATS
jgi:hypothetical protein